MRRPRPYSRTLLLTGLLTLILLPPLSQSSHAAQATDNGAAARLLAAASGKPLAAGINTACDEPDLRNAVTLAAQTSETVGFTQDCTITLSAPLVIESGTNVTLDGSGHHVTLDGGGKVQLFVVQANASLTLDRLTLSHGNTFNQRADEGGTLTGAFGGAINSAGQLTILNSTLLGNTSQGRAGESASSLYGGGGAAGLGGAIYSSGPAGAVLIANSTLISNTATGGTGGSNSGSSSIYGGNGAGYYGGYGLNRDPTGPSPGGFGGGGGAGIRSSPPSPAGAAGGFGGGGGAPNAGNGTGGFGGGDAAQNGGGGGAGMGGAIFIDGGTATIVNSTIVSNTAAGGAGGHSCFTSVVPYWCPSADGAPGQGIGGGLYVSGTLALTNTIVANNMESTGTDVNGSYINTSATNIVGGNAGLGPVQDNGGSTLTVMLLHGSPAIGIGDASTCQASPIAGLDQRGVLRPLATCDSGAVDTDTQIFYNLVLSAPAGVNSGEPFTASVSVEDENGIAISDYTGTVAIASTDTAPGVILPAPYQFTTGPDGDNGTHRFGGITLTTAGNQTLTTNEIAGNDGSLARSSSVTTTVLAVPTPTSAITGSPTPLGTPTALPATQTAIAMVSQTAAAQQTMASTSATAASQTAVAAGQTQTAVAHTTVAAASATAASQTTVAAQQSATAASQTQTAIAQTTVAAYPTQTVLAQQTQTASAAATQTALANLPTNTPTSMPTTPPTDTSTPIAAIVVTPAQVHPQQLITVTGTNFGMTEGVKVYWDMTSTASLTATTTSAGAFTAVLRAPQAAFGAHSVIAVGQRSSRSANAPVSIQPGLKLQPATGASGATVQATGAGFGALEPVSLHWRSPGGPLLATTTSSSVGTIGATSAVTFTVPVSPAGSYRVYATNSTTGAQTFVLFTVT